MQPYGIFLLVSKTGVPLQIENSNGLEADTLRNNIGRLYGEDGRTYLTESAKIALEGKVLC